MVSIDVIQIRVILACALGFIGIDQIGNTPRNIKTVIKNKFQPWGSADGQAL